MVIILACIGGSVKFTLGVKLCHFVGVAEGRMGNVGVADGSRVAEGNAFGYPDTLNNANLIPSLALWRLTQRKVLRRVALNIQRAV